MNTVDLRRPRRFAAACAAVAAFAWPGAQHASAEVANPNLIPSDSAYVFSVPNTPALWSAWEANGLYDAYKKIMAMPELEEKLANFRKEMGIVESSLGFKIDGKTFSEVFGSAEVYLVKGKGDFKGLASIAILKVTDKEKLTKLIDLAEKAAAQAESTDDDTSGSASADEASSSTIKESDYKGVKIKTFASGDDEEGKNFLYAQADDKLLLGNAEDQMHQVIDRLKSATPASGTIATSEDFKKVDAGLAAEKGEIYVYGNQTAALDMQSGEQMPGKLLETLKSSMETLAPLTYYGASVKLAPKEISSFSYGLLKAGTSDSLIMKNTGETPLKAATYVPETTLLTAATSLFDAPATYNIITTIADEVTKQADEDKSSQSVEEKLKSAEPLLGFSVKNDLVPALGHEIGFALNDVKFGGLIPMVDATIMLGVQDKAKMQKVTDSLERLATNAMAAKSSDSSTSAPKFETEDVGGKSVKTLQVSELAGFSPGFVLTDDFLIIGTTKSALKNSLEANSSGKNVTSSEAFKSLGHSISANANVIQFANINKILDVAEQITKSFAPAKEAGKYIEVLKVMDVSGSSSRVENGAAVSHGVLKLK